MTIFREVFRPVFEPVFRGLTDLPGDAFDRKWIMDLVSQNSIFNCAATARTCWGYATDGPSATESPVLITGIPADVECIVGGRWSSADSHFYTTDTSGNDLGPSTLKSTPSGTVKVFTPFPTYAAGAVLTGDQVAILTSAGNRVYMTALAEDTAVSVTVTDADIGSTVADAGGFNWQVEGYATIEGEQLEAASENELLNSDSPATQTTGSLATGDWTLTVFGTGSALISAGTATISGEAAASEGSPNTINVSGAGTVTVTVTGSLDYFQLESGTFGTSIIITAGTTLARAATTFSDNTEGRLEVPGTTLTSMACKMVVTPSGAGQISYLWYMSSGADDQVWMATNATQVVLRHGGATQGWDIATETYTHNAEVPMNVWFSIDPDGVMVKAFSVGDTEPAWHSVAMTKSVDVGSLFELFLGDGTLPFTGRLISCQLTTKKEDFGW